MLHVLGFGITVINLSLTNCDIKLVEIPKQLNNIDLPLSCFWLDLI